MLGYLNVAAGFASASWRGASWASVTVETTDPTKATRCRQLKPVLGFERGAGPALLVSFRGERPGWHDN